MCHVLINSIRRLIHHISHHWRIAFLINWLSPMRQLQNSRGQATTEYALVLLVAAVIATLVIAWATAGGGAGKIGGLFDSIFSDILDRAATPSE